MRKSNHDNSQEGIYARIAQVRLETVGPGGKSLFAKMLDVSPSTYDYYEGSRVPPADVLVRIAQTAGVDLNWLLTGQCGGDSVPLDHPVLLRAAAMLADRPDASAPLAAFVELLSASLKFPDTEPDGDEARGSERPADPRSSWIPILGRSAAGLPQFWSDADQSSGLTTLDDLISRNISNPSRRVSLATAATETEQATVELITLNQPDGTGAVAFVSAEGVKSAHPDAFALRIDGDSMTPDICHGDLVILSPSARAADGKAAVVQLDGQIGVTCKLFRREGSDIHLIPINQELAPQTYRDEDLVWALRVVARVRD